MRKRNEIKYLAVLGKDLGVATRDDFGLEGDSVGQGLFVGEATNLEDKSFGDVLVDDFKVERSGCV